MRTKLIMTFGAASRLDGSLHADEMDQLKSWGCGRLDVGAPIAFKLRTETMRIGRSTWIHGNPFSPAAVYHRPGHADLPGAIKYGFKDIRNVLERSSAGSSTGGCWQYRKTAAPAAWN